MKVAGTEISAPLDRVRGIAKLVEAKCRDNPDYSGIGLTNRDPQALGVLVVWRTEADPELPRRIDTVPITQHVLNATGRAFIPFT